MALGVYGAITALTWVRYGQVSRPYPDEDDDLLNRFMPVYDVVERHHVRVAAPASVTLDAAKAMELSHIPAVRAIIKARELVLRAAPNDRPRPRGILEETQSLGWVVLGDVPGREVVVGAVTKPWEANVTFRSIPPECFAAFIEPGYVKIVWTLRADPIDEDASVFRTETRAIATDVGARRRFRRYWSFLSPGIILIRWLSLGPVRAAAERAARERQV